MAERGLGKTIWALFVALLNATLILIAVCLWFGWNLVSTVQETTSDLSARLAEFRPVRDDAGALLAEVKALRADIAEIRDGADERAALAAARFDARLAELAPRLESVAEKAEVLVDTPGILIDRAVAAASAEIRGLAGDLRICRRSGSS